MREDAINILVLCDDFWHPAQIPRDGLAPLIEYGYTLDFIEDANDWSPERLASYPMVILTKSNNTTAEDQTKWMTDRVQAAFFDYVVKGNGLLAIHSGTAGYMETKTLRPLLGGVFTHHPEQCPVTVEPFSGHPLTVGSKPFALQDEHYFIELDDPQADVFMTTKSDHGQQPGAWRRTEGRGRVAVLTPGHNLEVWQHSSYQAIIRNALTWCGKSNVKGIA